MTTPLINPSVNDAIVKEFARQIQQAEDERVLRLMSYWGMLEELREGGTTLPQKNGRLPTTFWLTLQEPTNSPLYEWKEDVSMPGVYSPPVLYDRPTPGLTAEVGVSYGTGRMSEHVADFSRELLGAVRKIPVGKEGEFVSAVHLWLNRQTAKLGRLAMFEDLGGHCYKFTL